MASNRIKELQNEREAIQKKTFTKWINSHLDRVGSHVNDLYKDLSDGRVLLQLLHILSGEDLGQMSRGRLRINQIENAAKALAFLKEKNVNLPSTGPADIVDGNPRLILGLIWIIILRFQIQDIQLEDDSERRSSNEALLLWCKRKTAGYTGVEVTNFSTSWKDGLAFSALIHKHRPDLINFESLNPKYASQNLSQAFKVAEKELGIAPLLDPEDLAMPHPDDKSIMTYLVSYYHYFSRMKAEEAGGRRLNKLIGFLMEVDSMKDEYEQLVSNLLKWIEKTITVLGDRNFPNTLQGMQKLMAEFKQYRTEEKPPKYNERTNLEVKLFGIQMKYRESKQKSWHPTDGNLVSDLNRLWIALEGAEHEREAALRKELMRQEKLERLAEKFEKKAVLQDTWLSEMMKVIADLETQTDLRAVDSALKRHEAVSAEVNAGESRMDAVKVLCNDLLKEKYHNIEAVEQRWEKLFSMWELLLENLKRCGGILSTTHELMAIFTEIDDCLTDMEEMKKSFESDEYGKHLLGVQDLIKKHNLLESDIVAITERANQLKKQAMKFIDSGSMDTSMIEDKQKRLDLACITLKQQADFRLEKLKESESLCQFMLQVEEEEAWIKEKDAISLSMEFGKDLSAVLHSFQKHQALENEVKGREKHFKSICEKGMMSKYTSQSSTGSPSLDSSKQRTDLNSQTRVVQNRVLVLQEKWEKLNDLLSVRKTRLEESIQSEQYHADANEAESWIKEREPLVSSDDCGSSESSANGLLQNHERLQVEIKSYSTEIERLKELSKKIASSASTTATFGSRSDEPESVPEEEEVEMFVEYDEEVMEKREVEKEVEVDRTVPRVKALFKHQGQGMGFEKGEVFVLISKENKDWWSVKRGNGQQGYVPATYVKEIEPATITQKVKKTVVEEVPVIKKRKDIIKKRAKPIKRKTGTRTFSLYGGYGQLKSEGQNVASRQRKINSLYEVLVKQADDRHKRLLDSIKLFKLCGECEEVEGWVKEKQTVLQAKEKGSTKEQLDSMQKKYDTLISEMQASKARLQAVESEVGKLSKLKHPRIDVIKEHHDQLAKKWSSLQALKAEKEEVLAATKEVYEFDQMCEETKAWINEKDLLLSAEDIGRNLNDLQMLQRRHQAIERELVPISERVDKLNKMALAAAKSSPRDSRHIQTHITDINNIWDKLKAKNVSRKSQLDNAQQMHSFMADSRDLAGWSSEVSALLQSDELPQNVQGAEEMIQTHHELKAEIANKEQQFELLQNLGRTVISSSKSPDEIKDRMQQLAQELVVLKDTWEKRNKELKQSNDLQLFLREAEGLESVTANQEAFLNSDDLGNSVDEVSVLIRKHEDFEASCTSHDDKIKQFCDQANKLIHAGHYDIPKIAERRDAVISHRQKVKAFSLDRSKKLQASLELQKFRSDADEVSSWINEKLQSATDESYKVPTNLDGKIQKHQAFDAEIIANKGRMDAVCKTGNDLIVGNHYRSPMLKETVQQLSNDWKKLAAASTDKGLRLKQALDYQLFQRAVDEELTWGNEVSKQLSSEDIGKDLQSVRFLIEKHEQLEADMVYHKDQVQSLSATASTLSSSGHFEATKIIDDNQKLKKCFASLDEPLKERRTQLEESLKLQQFFRDAEDEMHWIKEHKPLATSDDVGKSLQEAQNLMKKHQSLLHDITTHEPNINEVKHKAEELIGSNHFASDEIQLHLLDLQSQWRDLKLQATKRTQKLSDSQESQKFFQEAGEADVWMNDKAGIAASQDFGRDEDAAVKLLKKHKILQEEVEGYVETVEDLGKTARLLIQNDHFDSANINARKSQLDEQLSGLQMLVSNRHSKLEESIKLHQYISEVEDVISWLEEKASIASSDDYGKDFEHLLVLQKKFEVFKRDITAGTDRYSSANKLARQLVAEGHSDTVMIKEKQDQMREGWNSLQDAIQLKGKKLAGAYEVHKFVRDAKDVLMRIKDKESTMQVDDLGKSIQGVVALQRKMETFEREVSTLGTKVRDLNNECLQLCSTHSGQSASKVQDSMEEVQSGWEQLQAATLGRKRKLKSALELQKLLLSINDIVSWIKDTSAQISGEQPVTSVSSAKELLNSHYQMKAEIDAREETIQKISRGASKLIQQGHYAKSDIQTALASMRDELSNLLGIWNGQKDTLDQNLQYQMFLQDVDNLETLCATHEVQLLHEHLGESVDQCEVLMKKHETFERLIISQKEKVDQVCEFGDQLIKENHPEADNIRGRKNGLKERRQRVKKTAEHRRNRLEDCRKYMVFLQDVMEAEAWIKDKHQIATDESFHDPVNLGNKKKKHAEFEAEVNANEQRIQSIAQVGEDLIETGHYASTEIESHVESLFSQWGDLQAATVEKSTGLKEALSFQQFKRRVDGVLVLIKEKTAVASIKDTGQDLDHCQTLIKKFNDFQKELSIEKSDVHSLNKLADGLISEDHSAKEMIERMKADVNSSWAELEELVKERHQVLEDAEQIHKFISEAAEINDRMNEKAKTLNVHDDGKDLEGVQSLLMRHEELEKDLTAIEDKLEILDKESERLIEVQPSCEELIQEKLEDIIECWEELIKNADKRKARLTESLNYQKFLTDLRDLLGWMSDITKRNLSEELARGVAEADALLQTHSERKNEMDQREENFKTITANGQQLIGEEHFAAGEISTRLQSLTEEHKNLWKTWNERQHLFLQCKELQILLKSAEQRDAWIGTQEAYLANENLGDSLSSVESLIKKHDDFMKSLENQKGKLEQLSDHASKLLSEDHYESPAIITRRDAVFTRYSRLKQQSKQRMRKLQDSKKLQLFLQEITEVEAWIAEKMQIASEESYLQMTNLQSKLQMHDAFQAELKANQKRVDDVIENGNELVDSNHYASHQIETCIDSLKINWRNLDEKSTDKVQKLTQAREFQVFEQEVEDIQDWISDMEKQLASQDLGKDLISVNNLLKECNMIEDEIEAHRNQIDDIQTQVRRFVEANHFMFEKIEDRGRKLVDRYCALEDPLSQRQQQLESSLHFQNFVHNVDEELNWIREREHQSSSTDLGNNLNGVQQLVKKHQSLIDELKGHEESVNILCKEGEALVIDEHFATSEIEERLKNLHAAWNSLNEQAKQRTSNLKDSLKLQQFLTKSTDTVSRMKDKQPFVSSEEYGKDEDSTLALMKKHEMVQQEFESYRSTVQELKEDSESMIQAEHYAKSNIQQKQAQTEELYQQLLSMGQRRHLRLKETKWLHEFNRECDEVTKWLKEKEIVASSEDTGRDLEHVEIIQKRFADFSNFLGSSSERIEKVNMTAASMIEDKHTDTSHIKKRKTTINAQWEALKQKADTRRMVLEAAKEIHAFNRDANDALQRIKEKEKALTTDDYGKDLSSVQALQKKHSGFEHDLAPLEKRIEQLSMDAVRLQKSQKKAKTDIQSKESAVETAWKQLKQKSKMRKHKLEQALDLQRYLDDFRDLNLWLNDMKLVILADELPHDVAGAEELLQRLSEHKMEIDDHKNAFIAFQNRGRDLVRAKHYAEDEITDKMEAMKALHKDLLDLWNEKKDDYEEHLDLQKYKHDAENADSWVTAQEALFQNIDQEQDSLDAVEEMIKRQMELEKMLMRQGERFKHLERETRAEKLERERIEKERKLQEEIEARKREEERRLEELRQKEEEERIKEEQRRQKEEEQRKLEEEKKKLEELKKQEQKLKAENETLLKVPPKKPPQLDISLTTGGIKIPKSDSTASGFYDIPTSTKSKSLYKEGILIRKNELDEGARKAVARTSKPYYTVLSGSQLHFYKDRKDAISKNEAVPPINITLGSCFIAKDVKKKYAFRLTLPNGAEYLFVGEDDADAQSWVVFINNAIQTLSHVYEVVDHKVPAEPPKSQLVQKPQTSATVSPSKLSDAGVKKEDPSKAPTKQPPVAATASVVPPQEKVEEKKGKRRFTLKKK